MGNDTNEPIDFDIDFDKDTKILHFSANLENRQEFPGQLNRDTNLSHRLKLSVPYLNRDEYLYLSVLTTGNSNAKFCQVNGRGKGIRVLLHQGGLSAFYFTLAFIIFIGALAIFAPNNSELLEYIPHSIYETFGANIMKKEKYIAKWPLLYMIVSIGLATIVCGFLMYRGASRFRMRQWSPTEE